WWLERTDDECAAFSAAARRSTRPDAAAWRALADALPWLRRLHHTSLRPPLVVSPHRPIPGTGLLVPAALDGEPPRLAERWTAVGGDVLGTYHAAWRRRDPEQVNALCDWLARVAPDLVVTRGDGGTVWDPAAPRHTKAVREVLDRADAVAVAAVQADLDVIHRHTRAFLQPVVEPAPLPAPQPHTVQS